VRLAKLFGEKPKSREQLQELMVGASFAIRQQQSFGLRFVLITLAQK
jgi:hypothetical protein